MVSVKGDGGFHRIYDVDNDDIDRLYEGKRRYRKSEHGKTVMRNYRQSKNGKLAMRNYRQSEKGKKTQQKYRQSEKCKKNRKNISPI